MENRCLYNEDMSYIGKTEDMPGESGRPDGPPDSPRRGLSPAKVIR